MKTNHETTGLYAIVAILACMFSLAFASHSPAQVKPNRNLEQFNTLRMARPPGSSLWFGRMINFGDTAIDHWFKRYRAAGYNYVLVEVSIIDTTNPDLNPNDDSLVTHLRLTIRKAAQYGLRVIPQINIGSSHGDAWRKMSGRIQMNRMVCHMCNFGADAMEASPSYAADPLGIDTSFARILIGIRKAFADSVVRYPLEYIHLTYDEFANNYSQPYPLVGLKVYPIGAGTFLQAGNNDLSYPFSLPGGTLPTRKVSRAKVDSEFIANSGAPSQSWAVQQLVVNSLYRRLLQARYHLDPDIKMIIYADAFDAGFLGRLTFRTYNMDTVRFSGTMATLPGLSAPQAAFLRANLILMPWNYELALPRNEKSYNSGETFAQFTSSGFKILYGVAIHNAYYDDPRWLQGGLRAMGDYVDSSAHFRSSVLGYAAQWWPPGGPTPNVAGDISIATSDSVKSKGLFPRASIRYDQTGTNTLLLFR